jgi:chromatin remodeling complex protein RSC6
MFSVDPKQVEATIVPKKGRKNKEIALQHFEKSMDKIEESVINIDNIIKIQDLTAVEIRKNLKNVLKDMKEARKFLTKYKNIQYKPKRTRESHNTGLEKLRPISENMALFAQWEYGKTQKSRYDVTNVLCAYIKDNELRDPTNKTIITPDAKLKNLLKLEDNIVLKYPTMQKYLKNCFEEVIIPEDNATTANVVVEEKENKRGRKPQKETKETKETKEVTPIEEEPPKIKKSSKKDKENKESKPKKEVTTKSKK